MNQTTPKSLRLQIGLLGRTNVGKSSLLNLLAGQDVAITSEVAGTTTDVVEKAMEWLPLGPVLFLDTGGLDDASVLGPARAARSRRILDRADVVLLVTEPGIWTEYEEEVCTAARRAKVPVVLVVNKIDRGTPPEGWIAGLGDRVAGHVLCSCLDGARREAVVSAVKGQLIRHCPEDFLHPPALIGDLLPPGGLAVMVVPIDLQAPRGRLILPQVQAIRDGLDNDAAVLIVKEREYAALLDRLTRPPDLVVCDSQVVLKMVADTPPGIRCTTFSILFARFKGDLPLLAEGAASVDALRPGDRVLIAESCSHHAIEDDIGRVKIPRWLRQYTGMDLPVTTYAGRDYPEDLDAYRLVIHCGSCMLTRREMLFRIESARQAGVPITNYGVCISLVQGVLERVLEPFPAALDAYRARVRNRNEGGRDGDGSV